VFWELSVSHVNRKLVCDYFASIARVAVLAGILGMAACGWQLRAGVRLPPEVMPVQVDAVDRYSAFYRELQKSLIEAGATLVQGTETAGAKVRIGADQTTEAVLSRSSRNTPEEYVVSYNIEYAVDFQGREVVPMQSLGLNRVYSYDSNTVAAKQIEGKDVQQALARELAQQVLQRLASLKSG
jgi:LPS-assembly lipoprotein